MSVRAVDDSECCLKPLPDDPPRLREAPDRRLGAVRLRMPRITDAASMSSWLLWLMRVISGACFDPTAVCLLHSLGCGEVFDEVDVRCAGPLAGSRGERFIRRLSEGSSMPAHPTVLTFVRHCT
jgi:hypothetical protein